MIYTTNRYTVVNPGGGLPFYNKPAYQHRYLEKPQQTFKGYMECPNNRLPTWQIYWETRLSGWSLVKLHKVVGLKTVATYTIPPIATGTFFEICIQGSAKRFFFTTDQINTFAFPSGFYYFQLQDSLDFLYSEVFHLGGDMGCVTPTVTAPVTVDGGTGTVEITVGVLTTSGLTVTGTPQLFTPSAPGGVDYTNTVLEDIISGSSIEVRVETETVEYGKFTSRYDVAYTNPQIVVITPISG